MIINKEDLPLVAMEFMNVVHLEDVDIINDLFELILVYENEPTELNEENINQKYMQWQKHTVEHFQGEEVLMLEKNFPPYQIHKGEHENSLALMQDIFNQWRETKDIKVLKTFFIEVLPDWLIQHIQSMDTVTAMFLKTGFSPCSMR